MIDVADNPRSTLSANEIAPQQLQDRISLRRRSLSDNSSDLTGRLTLQKQYKQLRQSYNHSIEKDASGHEHTNRKETAEDKLQDLRRQTSELKAQSRNSRLVPKAYASWMASSNIASPQNGIGGMCAPADHIVLPPTPSASSSPPRRRMKSLAQDDIHTGIDFATEIGQGLLLEVRKMHGILQEKEETIKMLEISKAKVENTSVNLAKQLRAKDESEDQLKGQCWDLEVTNQEMVAQIAELQQKLAHKTIDHNRVSNKLHDLAEESDVLKTRHEQQSEIVKSLERKMKQTTQCAKQDHSIDTVSYISSPSLLPLPTKLESARSVSTPSIQTSVVDSETEDTGKPNKEPGSEPGSEPTTAKLEQELGALRNSLSHAHGTVAQLRASLHMERTEKTETKRLLCESQEAIERLRQKKNVWTDEEHSPRSCTPTVRRIPSKRQSAARYARDLNNGTEGDQEYEIEVAQCDEDAIRPRMSEETDNDDSLEGDDDDSQPPKKPFISLLSRNENRPPSPPIVQSLGEELKQAGSLDEEWTLVDKPEHNRYEIRDSEENALALSPQMSDANSIRSQRACHAKRASPMRRNLDSTKECNLRRSPKLRDFNNQSPSSPTAQKPPLLKNTMSDTTKGMSSGPLILRPSRSESRAPVLSQRQLPPTSNLSELSIDKGGLIRKNSNSSVKSLRVRKHSGSSIIKVGHDRENSKGSNFGLPDMAHRADGQENHQQGYQRRSLNFFNKTSQSQLSSSSTNSVLERSMSSGDQVTSNAAEPGLGEAESRAKSAFIESVMALMEDPDFSTKDMPRLSLIIRTSSRELKLKAKDELQHKIWFEALKYLLLHTSPSFPIDIPDSNTKQRRNDLTLTINQASFLRKASHTKIQPLPSKSIGEAEETSQGTFSALSTLFHRPSNSTIDSPPTSVALAPQKYQTLSHRMSMRLRPLSTVSTTLSIRRRQSAAAYLA